MVKQEMEQPRSNSSREENRYLGVAVHIQVKKIRQEIEKFKYPFLQQPEIRPVFRDARGNQRSRSPLGLAERDRPPVYVGN